jgi:hypothetical protein
MGRFRTVPFSAIGELEYFGMVCVIDRRRAYSVQAEGTKPLGFFVVEN